MGITSMVPSGPTADRNNLSLGLGGLTNGVSVLDMARAYAPLANGGFRIDLMPMTKLVRRDGKSTVFKPKRTQDLLRRRRLRRSRRSSARTCWAAPAPRRTSPTSPSPARPARPTGSTTRGSSATRPSTSRPCGSATRPAAPLHRRDGRQLGRADLARLHGGRDRGRVRAGVPHAEGAGRVQALLGVLHEPGLRPRRGRGEEEGRRGGEEEGRGRGEEGRRRRHPAPATPGRQPFPTRVTLASPRPRRRPIPPYRRPPRSPHGPARAIRGARRPAPGRRAGRRHHRVHLRRVPAEGRGRGRAPLPDPGVAGSGLAVLGQLLVRGPLQPDQLQPGLLPARGRSPAPRRS